MTFRSVWKWVALAILLSSGPYLLAWFQTPPDMVFTGILSNHNDFSTYTSAMRQGADGLWLYHFNFSPEVWQPKLMLSAYMVAGKLVRSQFVVWFNVLRVLGLIFTLWSFIFWAKTIFPEDTQTQKTTWFILVFGGGVGWLMWPLLSALNPNMVIFPDIVIPEWTTTLAAVSPPHFIFGLGLEVLFFALLWRMVHWEHPWRWAGLATPVGLVLALTYVYLVAVIGFVVGLYMLRLVWQKRAIPIEHWVRGGIVLLPLIPLALYYGYFVNLDPAWQTYVVSDGNILSPVPFWGVVIGWGLVFPLAVFGLRQWSNDKRDWLIPLWLIGNLLVTYLPIVSYSGRFQLGLFVPLGTLAAFGLERVVLPYFQKKNWLTRLTSTPESPEESTATVRRLILILLTPSTLMVSLFLVQNVVLNSGFPNYLPRTEVEAIEWLASNTSDDAIILSDYPASNYLPSFGSQRVFLGQLFFTLYFAEKEQDVIQFWQADTSQAWRDEFLDRWQITHVYEGRFERALDHYAIPPIGSVIYEQDGIVIYEVD